MSRRLPLRPARFDDLGLRRALSDRLLPGLVAAMTFLAALTLAGVVTASSVAEHWQAGAASVLTVQVPQPNAATADGTRLERVTALLRGSPGIAAVRVLSQTELATLLRPWLGTAAQASALPLPAVLEVRLAPGETDPDNTLQSRLVAAAPGTFLESQGLWLQRLTILARSLQAIAAAALALVAGVGAAVVAVATRAGLAARRDAIEIVHGLGATDGFIAARFANRATLLAVSGRLPGRRRSLSGPGRAGQPRGTVPDDGVVRFAAGPATPAAMAVAAGTATDRGRDWLGHRANDGASMAAEAALTVRWFATTLGSLLLILVLALGAGFAVFAAAVDERPGPTPTADGIVALTGGAERVETALRLLDAGQAKMLLVSGVAPSVHLHDFTGRVGLDPAQLAPRVTLGRSATTTLGNATEAADWARDHDLHSLIIVTASYHMPRAMLEMRRAMPSILLYPLPVEPQSMRRTSKVRLLVGEYAKFIAAWLGASRMMRHPVAFVHSTHVDKSVSG